LKFVKPFIWLSPKFVTIKERIEGRQKTASFGKAVLEISMVVPLSYFYRFQRCAGLAAKSFQGLYFAEVSRKGAVRSFGINQGIHLSPGKKVGTTQSPSPAG